MAHDKTADNTLVFPQPIIDAVRISQTKAADYKSTVGRAAYFPMGAVSYAQMIHTKSMRIINLAKSDAAPNHESMRDSCVDLINYACYLAEALDKGELS